jgi:GDP/UDP-N,N'-diacetylbacillosamine 2-epimerase (hydrolysing)
MKRRIGVVTVARSDYGIYFPILKKIQQDPALELVLIVGGMHLSPEFGSTVNILEADGFEPAAKVEMLLSSDSAEGVAKSVGIGVIGFAQAYSQLKPDLLLLLGDRFEMLAAAVAAVPFKIPMAHIHGGESTEGLIDEAIRHSITKMSHIHFASTEAHAARIRQLGEEPWRVTVSGAPSLDNLKSMKLLSAQELERQHGLDLSKPPLLVTYHPVTLDFENTEHQITELMAALKASGLPLIFTFPNADASGRKIIEMIQAFVKAMPQARITVNLGTEGYFSLMSHAGAMVGNSSSGIVEAASFKLPVVNIGDRQRGRFHAENVVDCGYSRDQILSAIKKATSAEFRKTLGSLVNPYGDGHAADRIVAGLKNVTLDSNLLLKRFHQISEGKSA